eukprot:508983-Karenia_brevis.AAC.1
MILHLLGHHCSVAPHSQLFALTSLGASVSARCLLSVFVPKFMIRLHAQAPCQTAEQLAWGSSPPESAPHARISNARVLQE